MDLQLNGKQALISGSTAGIGYAIARSLAREGCRVIINGRTQIDVFFGCVGLQRSARSFFFPPTAFVRIKADTDLLPICFRVERNETAATLSPFWMQHRNTYQPDRLAIFPFFIFSGSGPIRIGGAVLGTLLHFD